MNNNPFKPMANNNLIEDTKDKWVLCIPSLDKAQTQRFQSFLTSRVASEVLVEALKTN